MAGNQPGAAAPQRNWCLFTSAGDRNAVRMWTETETPRRFDLVVAYYDDSDAEFEALAARATHAFRRKASKFQNLRALALQEPGFFDRYSHVWVCDDDIVMTPAQIDESFAIAEAFGFWVAQPSFSADGKIAFWFTYRAPPPWDFHYVNFIEENTPIFRREKLEEFLAVYDGVHPAWGLDYWYMNVLKFDSYGRFAIIDRVQVVNPIDAAKGGRREIARLKPEAEHIASFHALRANRGIADYPMRILAYGRITSLADKTAEFAAGIKVSPTEVQAILDWLAAHQPSGWSEAAAYLGAFGEPFRWQFAIHLARGLEQVHQQRLNQVTRTAAPAITFVQSHEAQAVAMGKLREIGEAAARNHKLDAMPVYGIEYTDRGAVASVRTGVFRAPDSPEAAAPPTPPHPKRQARTRLRLKTRP